jgi:hypothetical protein
VANLNTAVIYHITLTLENAGTAGTAANYCDVLIILALGINLIKMDLSYSGKLDYLSLH